MFLKLKEVDTLLLPNDEDNERKISSSSSRPL
jgi:hypothetical protein